MIFFLLDRQESRSALELKGKLPKVSWFFRLFSRFQTFSLRIGKRSNVMFMVNEMNQAFEPAAFAKPFRIICVCLGNICRSPAAQAVLERLIRREGFEPRFQVDSAGTASYHIGRPPDSRMLAIAASRGYELTSVAKSLTNVLVAERNLILAMDRNNYEDIVEIANGKTDRIRMWSDFLDESWPREVPDPYYGGQMGFEYVMDMLEAAATKILAECVQAASADKLEPRKDSE